MRKRGKRGNKMKENEKELFKKELARLFSDLIGASCTINEETRYDTDVEYNWEDGQKVQWYHSQWDSTHIIRIKLNDGDASLLKKSHRAIVDFLECNNCNLFLRITETIGMSYKVFNAAYDTVGKEAKKGERMASYFRSATSHAFRNKHYLSLAPCYLYKEKAEITIQQSRKTHRFYEKEEIEKWLGELKNRGKGFAELEKELASWFMQQLPGAKYKKNVGFDCEKKKISFWVKGTSEEVRIRFNGKTIKGKTAEEAEKKIKEIMNTFIQKEKIRLLL